MMVEMIAPAPVAFGPGGVPDNGHGYSAGRQLSGMMKTLEKTGDIRAVARGAAEDMVTLHQEFFDLETVIPYGYTVLVDGKWIGQGKTLEEVSDVNAGGGDRIQRVIAVQDKMMRDKNVTQAVIASEDFGSGRSYLYLFQKKDDAISAYAIEYQGRQGELKNLLSGLTKRTDSPQKSKEISFDSPLFFNQNNQIQVRDVFTAALHSYESPQRKQEMQSYLTRFARDTDDLPNLVKRQQTRIEKYTQKIQSEILANADVVAGLSASAHAITTIATEWIRSDRALYEERLGNPGRRFSYDTNVTTHQELSYGESVSSSTDRIPLVYVSTATEPISSSDTIQQEERKDSSILKLFDRETRIEELSHNEKRVIEIAIQEEVIEPIVPALITLLYLTHSNTDTILFPETDLTVIDTKYHQETVETWQNFLTLLFSPETSASSQGESIVLREEESSREDTVIPTGEEITLLFHEMGAVSLVDGREITREERVYERVHDAFWDIAMVLNKGAEKEHIPYEVETEIVDVATEMLTFLIGSSDLDDKEKNKDEKTTGEMKEILALFLYQELELFGKEHILLLSENPGFITFMKEMHLYKPLLEKKKELISEKLQEMLSTELQTDHVDPESYKKITTLLFLFYTLHKNEPEKLSSLLVYIEQLKISHNSQLTCPQTLRVKRCRRATHNSSYLSQLERLLVSKQKKPSFAKASEGKAGIIYWFWFTTYGFTRV